MEVDWSDGDYERMAATLAPAAVSLVEFAGVEAEHHVLDVGCGTGNATLAAARVGARVTGVDPAEGLLEIARDALATSDADVAFHEGSADALPVRDGCADITVSAFAVIFAPDPGAALADMARATRPGGTIAFTTWRTSGAICAIGEVLRRRLPDSGVVDHRRWGDDDWVRALLDGVGLTEIDLAEGQTEFRADSPEEFLDELEQHHPGWRAALRHLGAEDRSAAHDEALEVLRTENEAPDAFLSTSTYLLARARVPS